MAADAPAHRHFASLWLNQMPNTRDTGLNSEASTVLPLVSLCRCSLGVSTAGSTYSAPFLPVVANNTNQNANEQKE